MPDATNEAEEMTTLTAEGEKRQCPFGYDAKECPYQETWAMDISTTMKGEIVFVCSLDIADVCPRIKEDLELWE